jgi:hypothetical protein
MHEWHPIIILRAWIGGGQDADFHGASNPRAIKKIVDVGLYENP